MAAVDFKICLDLAPLAKNHGSLKYEMKRTHCCVTGLEILKPVWKCVSADTRIWKHSYCHYLSSMDAKVLSQRMIVTLSNAWAPIPEIASLLDLFVFMRRSLCAGSFGMETSESSTDSPEVEPPKATGNESSQANSSSRIKSIFKTLKPFRGITNDLRGRIPHYKTDWKDGWSSGIR